MYTECPSCKTFFKITPNQLKAAGGKVRCGNCDEVFSALEGLVDVVPDEAVSRIQNEREADVDTSPEIPPETAQSKAEIAEALSEQLDESLADVELPESASVVDEDVEAALESAVVEEPSSEVNAGDPESKLESKREEINNDIDAALDGLFDGETEIAGTEIGNEAADISKPASGAVSELSAISEQDELDNLDFGDLGEDLDDGDSKKKDASSSASVFDKSKSELSTKNLMDDSLESDISSLSDFERELEQVSAAPLESEPATDSSFDLGDSFIDSDLTESESKAEATKKPDNKEEDSGKRRGDSYILEEIEGKKKGGSAGSSAAAKSLWILLIVVLLFVLLGQFAYLKRQDLAMYPETKPIIEKMCDKLNAFYPCEITPAKDVKAIELLERNVVSHPNAKNALLITSTIENKAGFDQAFPELVLTFSDINQKIIAKRQFTPAEYLSKDVDIDAGMKKSVPIKIMLEIVDPGEEAVNFEFNFQ